MSQVKYETVQEPKDKPINRVINFQSFVKRKNRETGRIQKYQIIEYLDGEYQCSCPSYFYRNSTNPNGCKHIEEISKYRDEYYAKRKIMETIERFLNRVKTKFKRDFVLKKIHRINSHITLKLEKSGINIYINGQLFNQCKYLLIINPQNNPKQEMINSIDEAQEFLSEDLHGNRVHPIDLGISKEQEFWGHASNLEAWVDNNYDTRLLHRNLAFPLLKKLTDLGDPQAKKVFKDEIYKRFESKFFPVLEYLRKGRYMSYFTDEEREVLNQIYEEAREEYQELRR